MSKKLPKTHRLRIIKVLEEDYLKIKKWAAVRDLRIYQIINQLVNK